MRNDRISVCKTPLLCTGGTYGWRVGNAIHVARARRDLDFILERPCDSYAECQQARRVRDYPVENGIQVVAEDTCDGGIATTRSAGIGGVSGRDGKHNAPDAPDLGLVPGFASRGVPVALFGEPA